MDVHKVTEDLIQHLLRWLVTITNNLVEFSKFLFILLMQDSKHYPRYVVKLKNSCL